MCLKPTKSYTHRTRTYAAPCRVALYTNYAIYPFRMQNTKNNSDVLQYEIFENMTAEWLRLQFLMVLYYFYFCDTINYIKNVSSIVESAKGSKNFYTKGQNLHLFQYC